jgi:glycolate oxidase FAD binding subunit
MSRHASPGVAGSSGLDNTAHAMRGVAPRQVVRITRREELVDAMRAAARDGLRVVPWGGGVALTHESAPVRYDVALDLTGLDRIVEYDPEDFTLTAEVGATLATLRATLAARGQELPLEAALAPRATLGGVLAADASGPRRLRFGAPHDRILGAWFVPADGTMVRSGGKVVKNVAGYGTHRLLCGSRGGLAVMVEASLKLAPAPGVRLALGYPADEAQITDPKLWPALPRLEPSLVSVAEASLGTGLPSNGAPYTVVIGLEDDLARVKEQERAVTAILGQPAARRDGDDAVATWQALADLEETAGPRLSFTTAANTPAALAPLLASRAMPRLVFHAPAGRLHLFPAADAAEDLAREVAAHGFTLMGTRGLDRSLPALAGRSGSLALRARLRAALDPNRTLALGEAWADGAR